jgi:hypothetical protein
MLAILVVVVGFATILVMLLLVIVVIGIRQEPPTEELTEQAPSLIAAFVRRLLGIYIRKSDSPPSLDQGDRAMTACRNPAHQPNGTGRVQNGR